MGSNLRGKNESNRAPEDCRVLPVTFTFLTQHYLFFGYNLSLLYNLDEVYNVPIGRNTALAMHLKTRFGDLGAISV